MKITLKDVYQCNDCGTIWEHLEDANCCCPHVQEVKAWQCPICEGFSEDIEDVKQCCVVTGK